MDSALLSRISAELDELCPQVLELKESTDWESLGLNDGVQGCMRITGDGKQIIKATGLVHATIEEIIGFINNPQNKKLWDSMTEEIRDLHVVNENFKVVYEKFKLPWPISDRDFVYARKFVEQEFGMVGYGKSFDGIVEEKDGVVRGFTNLFGTVFKRITEDLTEMTYIVSVDLRGMIPNLIAHQAGKSQCENINKIKEAMKKLYG